jgi:outer membrane protein insertion porin family
MPGFGNGGPIMPGPLPPAAPQYPAAALVPQEEMVVQVQIVGNRTISVDKILQKIRTRSGRAYVEEQVQQDVKELYKLGVFAGVRTLKQQVPGGVIVTFQLAERPLLQEVIIVGNDTFLTSSLKKEADLKVGDAADPFAVENGRRKIEDYYKNKGFSKVRVTVLEGNKAGDLRAVFFVDEGPRQKILWINFVGNNFVSSARLKTIIQSHPPYLYLFSGEVDRKQIDEDVAKLTAYYRSFGFYFARVGRILEFNEKQNWLTLTFVIDEGPRYVVRNVSFLGNKKVVTERLAAKLKLLSGQFYDQNQQNLDLQKLRDEYGGDGYVFAKIEADNRLLDQPGTLDIVYNIDEGSRYRVGRINIEIKGENPHTQIFTVLNRLSFKPGDIVDTREIAASERRLKSAQLYKVEPQKGVEPKIVYSPPALEDKDTQFAGQRRTSYYRVPGGDAPLPPGEAYLNIDFGEESPQPEAGPQQPVPNEPPPYAQPTFQGQTFQPAPYANPVAYGQAYPAPCAPPQTFVPAPIRHESEFMLIDYPTGDPTRDLSWVAEDSQTSHPMFSGMNLSIDEEFTAWRQFAISLESNCPRAAFPTAPQQQTTYYRAPGAEDPFQPGDSRVDWSAQPPQSDPRTPQNSPVADAAKSQPVYQGQTFQTSTGAPCLPPAGQAVVPVQARYEPSDGWTQPQPQPQGQSWQPSGYGNSGSYGGSYGPAPAYPAGQQPAVSPMVYNPPAAPAYNYSPTAGSGNGAGYYAPPAAPYGGQVVAPPSANYGPAPYNAAPAPANLPYGYPPAAPGGYTNTGGQGPYSSGGTSDRPVAQMAAAGDMSGNAVPSLLPQPTGDPLIDLPMRIAPEETQTGRLMFGVGVNSDAGLVGNITVDEQNFDWRQFPTSWQDIVEGRAFRGAGERFRLELVPGTQVQRYSVTFQEPYLNNQPVSLGLNGYYYERLYPEWTETRVGAGISLGYQFTHDLTGSIKFLGQNVDIKNPEFPVPSLEAVVGHSPLFTTSISLQHDTRDSPFMATEGHLFSATLEETVGAFQYPRAMLEWSQFFRIFERADRSGKHVLSLQAKAGYSGDNTPIFDRFYAGGFSSIRGFAFRGVTPRDPVYGMGVGGNFQMTATAQYLFPITADDMLKGVVFVDAGTVEPTITSWVDAVRVAPGFGLRISIPMMGPAPIALDFAFPVSQMHGDQTQIFSFFVGFNH